MLVFPGIAIFLAVLGVNLVADGLADILDPRLKLSGLARRIASRQAKAGSHPAHSPRRLRSPNEPTP